MNAFKVSSLEGWGFCVVFLLFFSFGLKEAVWKFGSASGTVKQLLSLITDSGCILVLGKALADRFRVFEKEACARNYRHLYTRHFRFSRSPRFEGKSFVIPLTHRV